ncbi:uncharacterized protein LOC120389965 isoform X2 [Mauremys reevesii]|uniref:uncharacterized protein LOC120389965 isoform X2 n=1 Tax=Mauremys reevesii TaxID=260615 RepID=UPI00193F0D66|nr:uncharacterized protein LOC120389965 isoform X2 [Mauremys reevesii]
MGYIPGVAKRHKTAYQVKLTQIDSFKTDLMKSRRSRPDIIIMPKESEEELLTSHMHQSNEEVNEMMSKILGDLEPTELILRKQLPLKNLQEIITQKKQNTYVDSDVSQKIRWASEKRRRISLEKRRKRFILAKSILRATRNDSWISRKYNKTQICMIENKQTSKGKRQEQDRNIKFRNQKQTPKYVRGLYPSAGKAKKQQTLKYTKNIKNRKANWRKKNSTSNAKKEQMLVLKERRKREIYIQKRVKVFKNPVVHDNSSNYFTVYGTPVTVQNKLSKRLRRNLIGFRRNTRERSLNNFLQKFGDFLKYLARHRTVGNEKVTGIDISLKIKKKTNKFHVPMGTQKPNLKILILSKSTAQPPGILSFPKHMGRAEKKRKMSHMNSWKTPHSVSFKKIKHNSEHKFRLNTFRANEQNSVLKTKGTETVKQMKKIEKGMAERPRGTKL